MREAGVHAEDRGFQFADSIYEVCEILDGRLIDEGRHMDRFERSLGRASHRRAHVATGLGPGHARGHEAQSRADGIALSTSLAWGRSARFRLSRPGVPPTLVCLARRVDDAKREARADDGISVITAPDVRWGRCDIKTVMLLPACLAKDEAARHGRQRGLVRRPGRLRDRGGVEQRLDHRCIRNRHHTSEWTCNSARRYASGL